MLIQSLYICKPNITIVITLMNTDISDRINELIDSNKLTKKSFAEVTGLSQPIVSHLTTGRNQPGLDVLQKMLTAFPDINPEWLIMGKEPMYKQGSEEARQTQAKLILLEQKLVKLQRELLGITNELRELTEKD